MALVRNGQPVLCPRHGRPIDSCEPCERLIAAREFERDWPVEDDHADEDRYERWLDTIGGSR